MQIQNTIVVDAPIQKIWDFLLDASKVAKCVPGVENVQTVDENNYVVDIVAKVGFIKAKFKVKLKIAERKAPTYLRSEGSGDESGMTSSLKTVTELHLKELGPKQTEVASKTDVNVFGKLGTFGHSVIKGKADKMWEEFGSNLKKQLVG
ncbi:MAG: SRPBCC family protein [Candidatus Tectomicrobia bacterium]|nr:SRPBCC family protein [Candidatus Tectomicrobia bacterium]